MPWEKVILILVFVFSNLHPGLICANNLKSKNIAEVVEYLHEYGYLSYHHGNVISQVQDGLMNFQKHMGMQETGKLDTVTMKSMRMSRCGNVDMMENENHERTEVPPDPWVKKSLTYRIDNTSASLMNLKTIRDDIRQAFHYWVQEADIHIAEELDKTVQVDIDISFETGPHNDNHTFNMEGTSLAHAFYPNHEENLNGDIHFNDYKMWSSGAEQSDNHFDFLKVATHEIGHALGLSHSEIKDSIMFPMVSGDYDENFMLHASDKENIKNLYSSLSHNDLEASPSEHFPNENFLQGRIQKTGFVAAQENQNAQYTQNPEWNDDVLAFCVAQLRRWPFQCYGYWGSYCCLQYLQRSYLYQQRQQYYPEWYYWYWYQHNTNAKRIR